MRYFVLGIILIFSYRGVCQISEPPRDNRSFESYVAMLLDSLMFAEKTKNTINIIRYSAVLTTQLQATDFEKAALYLKQAFQYASSHPEKRWYADVCNRAGMLMLSYANNPAALKKLSRSAAQLYDSSMFWHRQAINTGIAIGRNGTIGWGYRGLLNTAISHYQKSIRDSIPHYYNHAIAMAILTRDLELKNYSNSVYGAYLKQQSDRNKVQSGAEYIAYENFKELDDIATLIDKFVNAEALKDTASIISHAFNLSTAFRRALMLDQASKYITIALSYAKKYQDATLRAYAYLHKGSLMIDMGEPDSAGYYYLKTIKTGNGSNPAGWAYYHLLRKKIEEPINKMNKDSIEYYYNSALEVGKRRKNVNLKISIEMAYYRYLTKVGDFGNAESLLQSLYGQQAQMDVTGKEAFYSSVHDFLAKANRLDTLIELKRLYSLSHDVITAAKHQDQLYAKDQQYEVSKTKSKLEATSIQLNNTAKILTASVAALICFGLLIAYLFHLFRKNKRLSQRNELLLKEQNHRVKNNLQMISSLLSLQSQKLLSTDAKDALEESKGRINSVALLHRMLYEGENVGSIEATAYLQSLTEEIRYSAGRDVSITLNLPERISLKIEKVTSLGLIINELLTNSIKHVDYSTPLEIHLSITESEGKLCLSYADNGQGVSKEAWMASPSFGNQLIQIQGRQLRGEFEITTRNGFQYELKISA
ncbi:MAG: sensor histidine kinase [Cyclobacteriaceae bacterium]|nr:sensor histidine kinase [Cyclobacteriaceae bacterium]